MQKLQIDTGVVEYSLNDSCTVRFNPTDPAFVEELYRAFSELDAQQEAHKREVAQLTDNREIFALARRRDAEMRELIGGVFGQDVCTALFGSMNVYATAGGLPLWANLLLAVMDTVDEALGREQVATNPRIEKYLKKYRK